MGLLFINLVLLTLILGRSSELLITIITILLFLYLFIPIVIREVMVEVTSKSAAGANLDMPEPL